MGRRFGVGRGVEEVEEKGGLCHCLLSFFHPKHCHNQHITHFIFLLHSLTLPVIVLFPFPFSFQLLLFFSISSSLFPPRPCLKSPSSTFPFSLSHRWKCKHLRQTEAEERNRALFINRRPCAEVTTAGPGSTNRGESLRSYNNTSKNILLIVYRRRSRLGFF